jgi:light-regulated signal transduction histidine kinase (bacteriophytochrome)
MSPAAQSKVLRLLDEQRFERVGGNETIVTDVRIISATNRDLKKMIDEGKFRADLSHRLHGYRIDLPPLRQRGEDVALLIGHLLARFLEGYALNLEQSNHRLMGFAHILAHEVKSPLTTVTACLKILDEKYGGQFDEEIRGFVADSHTAIRSVSELVNTLLEFARVGSRLHEMAQVDMEAVFYHVSASLRVAIKEAGAKVTHDPLPTVVGDELQIRQLLQNLIGNAIKYRGAEPPRIHVGAEESEGQWTFSVRDNGVGIDPQQQERIFVIFVRLEHTAESPGAGIGLALCKLVVENHGGRIWVEPAPGGGSTFRFTLPKRASQQSDTSSVVAALATGTA